MALVPAPLPERSRAPPPVPILAGNPLPKPSCSSVQHLGPQKRAKWETVSDEEGKHGDTHLCSTQRLLIYPPKWFTATVFHRGTCTSEKVALPELVLGWVWVGIMVFGAMIKRLCQLTWHPAAGLPGWGVPGK